MSDGQSAAESIRRGQQASDVIRTFDTGATRDTAKNKIDYEAFLSPLVIEAFGKYMLEHQVQSDGNIRLGDNWQKGFGVDHCDVCIKSGWRHFMDWWKEHRGYGSRAGMDAALAGLMFNLMAYWHWKLKSRNV